MTLADPRTVRLSDYRPWPFVVDRVDLTFRLHPSATRVQSRLHLSPNPVCPGRHDLRLDGEGLRLIALSVQGEPLSAQPDASGLTIPAANLPAGAFTLETEVEIAPEGNTALEGLYMSNGLYCTQCEAQGFRHITFYPDRPDVMARFRVRVESDLPVLLSNGNLLGQGAGWAEWDDPWPKPAYLFALVAGNLVAVRDRFITRSGRRVDLGIWVRPGDESRCGYAMDSLKRAMAWDERVYGREYDLDLFNIVAVDDFNMGAMENKGLNIFNARLVLASPETATDDDYGRIEAVIAHEYFHNWTGNRITCRDWFQLCLKEGLTVFRDQQFTGDMRSHAVKRIEDVMLLRARQFREDQGPLAHPVRPESFIEINNFYTATVYEKGAEVIGMLKRLVGNDAYGRALELYFTRHDGHAATIEDWLKVFEDATGRDLGQFARWYSEAGTPRLAVIETWDADAGRFTLTFTQDNPPTPGQPVKSPRVIPIAVGLLNPNGDEILPTRVLEMTQARQSFHFDGLGTRPIASILRDFSAPVVLDRPMAARDRAFLIAHDTDPFNRWEAARSLACDVLMGDAASQPVLIDSLARLTLDEGADPAFRALTLRLPGEDEIAAALAARGDTPDPDAIRGARRALARALAEHLGKPRLAALESGLRVPGPFTPESRAAGRRALRAAVLGLLAWLDNGQAARAAFDEATNMTDSLAALSSLLLAGQGEAELAAFERRWAGERLVMDKWFSLQIALASPDRAAPLAQSLAERPDFTWKTPNRFRAVFGALAGNHAGFHHASGAGYRTLAQALIRLDALNPQTAARVSTAFETWRRYDQARQAQARAALEQMAASPGLSRDLSEMVSRLLG